MIVILLLFILAIIIDAKQEMFSLISGYKNYKNNFIFNVCKYLFSTVYIFLLFKVYNRRYSWSRNRLASYVTTISVEEISSSVFGCGWCSARSKSQMWVSFLRWCDENLISTGVKCRVGQDCCDLFWESSSPNWWSELFREQTRKLLSQCQWNRRTSNLPSLIFIPLMLLYLSNI